MNKFKVLVGTLAHLHKKYTARGLNTEALETAMAVALLIEDGDLTSDIVEEMEAIADMLFAAEPPPQNEPKSPYVRPKWD